MTALNFILNHLGVILILAVPAIVLLALWAVWEDEKRFDKPPVCKSAHLPENPPQFKTPFQTAARKAIEAELDASRNHTINHFSKGAKPHPKPRKH